VSRFPDDPEIVREVFAELPPPPPLLNGETTEPYPHAIPRTIGKYLVLGQLGQGGQGSAFLARDPHIGQLVVLKRYHASTDERSASDALHDAEALTRLRTRYTPRCFGLERVGDELVLVMEYIPGRNLAEVMKSGLPSPKDAARLVEQVAEGLEAVHACGILHRDIKLQNIVQGDDRVPHLVDFGLAAHLGSRALRGVSGTPQFMAPEQARGDYLRIDGRTDLYGLGGVLYALLTGLPPHPGKDSSESLEHAKKGVVTPVRDLNRSVPRELERIVMKALEPDPDQRYTTAGEFRRALRQFRLGPARRAALAAGIAVVILGVFLYRWLFHKPDPVTSQPLSGELTVRVWSRDEGKMGWKIEVPGALPLEAGDQVRLEAKFNQPAYAYFLWLDGQGRVYSLDPWGDHEFHDRPAKERRAAMIESPEVLKKGHKLSGPPGLETVLMLARRTPLPAETSLADIAGTLPPTALRDPRELAFFGFHQNETRGSVRLALNRGIEVETAGIDDPLLQLMERLRQQHFEVVQAVRFAYRGPRAEP
jgi:hypothetical protein